MSATRTSSWYYLLEEAHPFAGEGWFVESEAGNVSPGMREAGDVTGADRIRGADEHNWNRPCLARKRRQLRIEIREYDIRRHSDEFGRVGPGAFGVAAIPARVYSQIAILSPAKLAQLLPKYFEERLSLGITFGKRQ